MTRVKIERTEDKPVEPRTYLDSYVFNSKQFYLEDKLVVIMGRINRHRLDRCCYKLISLPEVRTAVIKYGKLNNVSDLNKAAFEYDIQLKKRIESGGNV